MNAHSHDQLKPFSSRSRYLLLVVFAGLEPFLAGAKPRIEDDAFITFQYAKNLAEHARFVWHVNLEPVDGFTSLGHVLLLAPAYLVGLDPILWNLTLAYFALLAIGAIFLHLVKGAHFLSATAGLAVIALSADILYWLSGGLETILFSAFVFASYAATENAILRSRFSLPTTLVLIGLSIMRPEGIAFGGLFFLAYWINAAVRRTHPVCAEEILFGIVFVIAVAAQFAWRIQVFDFPFPNTYYAKQSFSRWTDLQTGFQYLHDWAFLGFGTLTVATLVALATRGSTWLRGLTVLAIVVIAAIEGGDPHPGFRFLLPALPLIALDIVSLLEKSNSKWSFASIAVVVMALTQHSHDERVAVPLLSLSKAASNLSQGVWPYTSVRNDAWSFEKARASREFGSLIYADTPVAANDLGALAFYSGQPILDIVGLNHPEIAHLPKPPGKPNIWGISHLEYLIKRKVPVVYLWFPRFDRWTFSGVSSRTESCSKQAHRVAELMGYDSQGLADHYMCTSVASTEQAETWHNFLVRRGEEGAVLQSEVSSEITDCVKAFRNACGM